MDALEDVFAAVSVQFLVGNLQLLEVLLGLAHHLHVRAALVVHANERRHVNLKKSVRIRVGHFTLASAEPSLSVAALDSLTFVKADIYGAAELHVRRVGEFEGAELCH